MHTWHPAARAFVVSMVALVSVVAGASPAAAHAFLVSTDPQAGARLTAPPTQLVLRFSEPLADPTRVLLERVDRHQRQRLSASFGADRSAVQVALPVLSRGAYRVIWYARSDDGHESQGDFAFGVGVKTSVSRRFVEGGASENVATVGTALWLLGLAIEIAFLTPFVTYRRTRRRGALMGALVAMVGAAVQLVAVPSQAGATSRAGVAIVIATGAVLLSAWYSVLPVTWAKWAASGFIAAAALAYGFSGHLPHAWVGLLVGLHLALALAWLAALGGIALTLVRRRVDDDVFRRDILRYSAVATLAVPLLIGLGVVSAIANTGTVRDLFVGGYGRVLFIKVVLAAIAVGLALSARRALADLPASLHRLGRRVRVELVAVFAAVVAASVLGHTAPPNSSPIAFVMGPPPLSGAVVHVADRPADVAVFLDTNSTGMQIHITTPNDVGLESSKLRVLVRPPRERVRELSLRVCGPGCWFASAAWRPGETSVDAVPEVPGLRSGVAHLPVMWPPGADGRLELARLRRAMRRIRNIDVVEREHAQPQSSAKYELTGRQFIEQETYAQGEVDDVRIVPGGRLRSLVLYLPGSQFWQRLWYDSSYRLRRSMIVSRVHRIDRTFDYR